MKRVLSMLLLLLAGCSEAPEDGSAAPPSTSVPAIDADSLDSFQAQVISNAQEAVRSQPQSTDAWGRLGQALEAAEFRAEAEKCYQRANELDPRSGRWLYLLSLLQLQDQPELALTNLLQAVERLPATNDAPRLRAAQALVERGRFAEAAPHLQQLLAVNPNHPAAHLELARIKFASNELGAVSELLRPALTNNYTARPAHLLLSQARQRRGDNQGAELLARRASAMQKPADWPDPYVREVRSLLATEQNLSERANFLIMRDRFDEAESLLHQLTNRAPENPEPLLLLGRLRIQQRRCAEAEVALQRHLALRTNSLQGYVQLGMARFCESRWKEAAEAFKKATELKPDFSQVHYNLGLALSRVGDSVGAVRSFQMALRSSPGDPNTHAAIAEELLRKGDPVNARHHADEALRIEPRHAKALMILQALPLKK